MPWLGSTTIGRCVLWCRYGTVASGSVKRVWLSNVRMPRSQSITLGLPSLRMYSAASSSSSIVALGPRLSSTGFVDLADRFQQAVVLHVAGADLQHVGVFGDQVDVFGAP